MPRIPPVAWGRLWRDGDRRSVRAASDAPVAGSVYVVYFACVVHVLYVVYALCNLCVVWGVCAVPGMLYVYACAVIGCIAV